MTDHMENGRGFLVERDERLNEVQLQVLYRLIPVRKQRKLVRSFEECLLSANTSYKAALT